MIDLKNVSEALSSVVEGQKQAQAQLEKLLQRQQELHTQPLPKKDFIEMLIEEQSLRENQLSDRLFRKYKNRIHEPMSPLKIRGINDSPLTWPVGTNDIPNDVWHVLFSKQINEAIIEAVNKWTWPEEVGPTRAEREEKLATLDKEINELRTWLAKAAQLSPR